MNASAIDHSMLDGLRTSVKECSDRGLFAASKWASELLLSVPFSRRHASGLNLSDPAYVATQDSEAAATSSRHPDAPNIQLVSESTQTLQRELEMLEADALSTARTLIEARNPMSALHALQNCRSSKAMFLSLYIQFLASEGRALRSWHKYDNNRFQPRDPVNPAIDKMLTEITHCLETDHIDDPWLLYLHGLFLSRIPERRDEAIESAILSIGGFPWNWAAWMLLSSCIGDGEELTSIMPLLPLASSHPMVQMFQVKTMNELQIPSDNEIGLCDQLLSREMFPGSIWLMSLRAFALYCSHEFKRAETQFERIFALDPHRVEDVDTYSNILYTVDNRLKLSRMANDLLLTDRDRPEVCCLVGNLYSLRGEHDKSVKFFRRATQLDRTYLPAWTLMGHEYVEMKNSHAAIESYRKAIEVNRKDYRAWYGLGQAYELLNMHQYALHYYHYATALRPYDVRLWQALGFCYQEMGKLQEAIDCFKRALITADSHEITLVARLADLYGLLQDPIESIAYHRRVVEISQACGRPIGDFAKSSLKVAEYQMNTDGDLLLAQEYLRPIAVSNVEEVVRATDLLKAVTLMLEQRRNTARVASLAMSVETVQPT
ncbi:unnamed protein product [Mycena citricolor]|uniref:Cdc23 domain-containing protein n=1 Tax=Mycena citricolor TaxID=2018698 RepID=A0AAD2H0C4_9AGAR|nr:unnamed protein product [Mycena citricolor]